jgi:uncharacterized membrane protein
MERVNFKQFVGKSVIGGVLVIAPVVVLLYALRWAVSTVRNMLAPLTSPIITVTGAPPLLVDLLALVLVFLICFLVGTFVTTRTGDMWHRFADEHLSYMPGYRFIRDIFRQLLGQDSSSPFRTGEVAIVQLYGHDIQTRCTALITSRHPSGWYTVFLPTGPNPTSGFIYHLPPEYVEPRPDIPLESAFRSIIACGVGSGELLKLSPGNAPQADRRG